MIRTNILSVVGGGGVAVHVRARAVSLTFKVALLLSLVALKSLLQNP